MAYKLGECFKLYYSLHLLTLVQFLHGIAGVHKTDNDKATIDSLKEVS